MAESLESLEDPHKSNVDRYVCAECKKVYHDPRLLACGDSFCLECLERLVNKFGRAFPCPVCARNIDVPDGGACDFKVNVYITEKDLKRAKSSHCPVHEGKTLVLYCVVCDAVICSLCKATTHDAHKAESLATVAERCKPVLRGSKGRLVETIQHLNERAVEARDRQLFVEQRRQALKKQVRLRYSHMVEKLNKIQDTVIDDVDKMIDNLKTKEESRIHQLENQLAEYKKLLDNLEESKKGDCPDTKVVLVEKEMRVGSGREEMLAEATTAQHEYFDRPGLHYQEASSCDYSIRRCLGCPTTLRVSSTPESEMFHPFLPGKQSGIDTLKIRSIRHLGKEKVQVEYGGISTKTGFINVKTVVVDENNPRMKAPVSDPAHSFTNNYHGPKYSRLNSKFPASYQLQVSQPRPFIVNVKQASSPLPSSDTELEPRQNRSLTIEGSLGRLLAFDANCNGELFAIIAVKAEKTEKAEEQKDEDGQDSRLTTVFQREKLAQGGPTPSLVYIYRRQSDTCKRIGIYQPDELCKFTPSDVCFWHIGGHEKLLVADYVNDIVHVVNVDDEECRFERYLGSKCSELVRPVSLDRNEANQLWIGCKNGYLLKCMKTSNKKSMARLDSYELSDTEEELSGLSVNNRSETTELTSIEMEENQEM